MHSVIIYCESVINIVAVSVIKLCIGRSLFLEKLWDTEPVLEDILPGVGIYGDCLDAEKQDHCEYNTVTLNLAYYAIDPLCGMH